MPTSATPEPLIVWSADVDEAAQLLRILEEGRTLDCRSKLPKAPAEGAMLLLHLAPVVALSRAMAVGTPPPTALEQWCDQVRDMLALNRSNRRVVRMLDVAEGLAHPRAFRRQFGLPEGDAPTSLPRNSREDPTLLTLAQAMLQRSPDGRSLAAELEAVSINFTGDAPQDPVDPEAVYHGYRAGLEAKDRAELLERQALAAQQDAEQLMREIREMQGRIDKQAAQLEEIANARATLETEVPNLRQRLTDQEQTLHTQASQFQQQRAELEAQAAHLESELHRVYTSHSFRITEPLRRLRAALSTRGRS